jgi:tight adherence protein B
MQISPANRVAERYPTGIGIMLTHMLILLAVFATVALLAAGAASMLSNKATTQIEERLQAHTAVSHLKSARRDESGLSLLADPTGGERTFVDEIFDQFFDLRKFLAQADLDLTPWQFVLLIVSVGGAGFGLAVLSPLPVILAPLVGIGLGSLPVIYAIVQRTRRLRAFAKQLPDALELIGRALRASHSLAAGCNLVGDEMPEPIRSEFARCYEEQNLGIPLEESLKAMCDRVPNLDLRFFATAVTIQRQTGGDLAEILDKIGYVIRERFKIWGQIQALTGEGRLSGVVLLSLPPVLFVVMYRLNADYMMRLFDDPIGHWLLGGAVLLQVLGAIVIKKIVTIRV